MAGSDIYKMSEYMEKVSKRAILKFKSSMGIPTTAAALPSMIDIIYKYLEKPVVAGGEKRKTNRAPGAEDKSDGEEEEDSKEYFIFK